VSGKLARRRGAIHDNLSDQDEQICLAGDLLRLRRALADRKLCELERYRL
jgi:hypothetical protein